MKYATGAAFRAALEQRLSNEHQQTSIPSSRLRKLVVFDRLLARLLAIAPDRWVLKGAMALYYRAGTWARPTKDVDLSYLADEPAATTDLIAVQALELGDFFNFVIEKVPPGEGADDQNLVRFHVRAELGGRLFEEITMDVSFSDPLRWKPDYRRGSQLLKFAGIEPIEVPVVSLEQRVAEKLHAYTRAYGSGRPSTRVKDLVDLVLVSRSERLDADRLREAIRVTFETRKRQPIPKAMPRPQADWPTAYRRLATEVDLDPDLDSGFSQAAAFLDPVLAGATGHWDPSRGVWVSEEDDN